MNKNFYLITFQGKTKGNGIIFLLVIVAYTLVAETGKMIIRYSKYLLIVFFTVRIDCNESLIFTCNEDGKLLVS